MSFRIAVVTAFSRGYDRLLGVPTFEHSNFFAFSDICPSYLPPSWQPRPLPAISLSPKRRCVYVKTHLHSLLPGFDYYLWLDARINLTVNPDELVNRYKSQLAHAAAVTFQHPRNHTLEDEINEVVAEGLVDLGEISSFRRSLLDHPTAYVGMCETNVMLTANSEPSRALLRQWWRVFETSPARDQLALLPALRESGTVVDYFDHGQTDASTASFVTKGTHNIHRRQRLKQNRDNAPSIPARSIAVLQELDVTANPPPSSGVVVPFHNNGPALRRLISSLDKSDEQIQILIVDNGSTTENSEICDQIASQASQPCEVLRTSKALGFGGAANYGISRLGKEHAFLVNSDTQFPSLSLEHLSRVLQAGNFFALGFVGNRSGDQTIARDAVERLVNTDVMSTEEVIAVIGAFCKSWSRHIPPQIARTIHGSAMLLDVKSFLNLGGFDTDAFPVGYGEEVDLCVRAELNGHYVGISTCLFYWHDGGGTFGAERRRSLNERGKQVLHSRYPWFPWSTVSREISESPLLKTVSVDLETFINNHLLTQYRNKS